jgi:hypothetical protein
LFNGIGLEEYCEPKKINDIMNADDFVETETFRYELGYISDDNLFIIQVKVLHHLACVELTLESIRKNSGKPIIHYDRQLIGERLTLKYF